MLMTLGVRTFALKYGIRQQLDETEGRVRLTTRRARPAGRYVLIGIAMLREPEDQ